MKLQNNNGQFRITLPKDIVKSKKWKQGTELIVVMNEKGNLVLKEVKQ